MSTNFYTFLDMSTEKLIFVLTGPNFGSRHVDKYIEMSMSLVFLPEPNLQSRFDSKINISRDVESLSQLIYDSRSWRSTNNQFCCG
jgi:hypothetical protein